MVYADPEMSPRQEEKMTTNLIRPHLTRHRLIALVTALAVLVTVLMMNSVANADSDSAKVHDPRGDALSATESANNVDPGTPDDEARDYLDIKSVKVSKDENNNQYVFTMKVAGRIPQDFSNEVCYSRIGIPWDTTTVVVNPPDPSACFFAWNWDLDDDTDLFNGSLNLAPTVRWINGAFQGIMFTDAAPVLFSDFSVKGKKLVARIDANAIEGRIDTSQGVYFTGVSRNHRIDFGGDPLVGVADVTDTGQWTPVDDDDEQHDD